MLKPEMEITQMCYRNSFNGWPSLDGHRSFSFLTPGKTQ